MSPTVMVTAKVPADLVQSLRATAQLADRSLSAELRCAIRKHLATSDAPAGSQGVEKADRSGRHDGS